MKRRKECRDGRVTVAYGIHRQLDKLVRNRFRFSSPFSLRSREVPSFSLSAWTEGMGVLVHAGVMQCFGRGLQAEILAALAVPNQPKYRVSVADNLKFTLKNSLAGSAAE
jgi:hypothetical protein